MKMKIQRISNDENYNNDHGGSITDTSNSKFCNLT